MKLYSMIERKAVANEFGERLNLKPEYQGAPTFAYKIGAYTIMKDGSIDVEDDKADLDMLRQMNVTGFIDNSWDEEREVIQIEVPTNGHSGKTLVNLARILFCRSQLINKAIGCNGAFHINERFLELLDEQPPETIEDFLQVLELAGWNDINEGIEFSSESIGFFGFPKTEDSDRVRAFTDLVELINKMAISKKRILMERSDNSNEKYAFRVWLLSLGMKGEKYKMTRKVLLENLSGHSAFRTKEQEEAVKEKNKAKRAAAKG